MLTHMTAAGIATLGRDPETRYTPSGAMNLSFSCAVNTPDGQGSTRTTWYRCTAWNKLAETLDGLVQSGKLAKGTHVYLSGGVELRPYQDNNGQQRYSLDVRLDKLTVLAQGQPGTGQGVGNGHAQGSESYSNFDEVPY